MISLPLDIDVGLLFLGFQEISVPFLKMMMLIYIPTSGEWITLSLYIHQHLLRFVFDNSYSKRSEKILVVHNIPLTVMLKQFLYSCWPLYVLKELFSFVHLQFFPVFFFFSILLYKNSINPLLDEQFPNICYGSVGYIFTWWVISLL